MDKVRSYYTPAEIAENYVGISVGRVTNSLINMILLGFLAGAFVGFAASASNMASFNLLFNNSTYGIGRVVAGASFATGLMLIVIAGGEIFTGNSLLIIGVLEKKVRVGQLIRNWCIIYISNFAGAILIAFFMVQSGLFNNGGNLLGGITVKIATYKSGLDFVPALILGVMGNWIVCLAVWMAAAAKDIAGKCIAIFFGILTFVTLALEHSIANMYYIPAGLFAKGNADWAAASSLSSEALDGLTWGNFFLKNLVPVTIGNLIGGVVFVGVIYWFVYLRKAESK